MSKVLLVNKQNRNIYVTYDAENFVNVTTNKGGAVTPEQARNSFAIPMQLNAMNERNPNVLKLVNLLNLSLEKSNETENIS